MIAIVALCFPTLDDKKQETNKKMFCIQFECGYTTVTKQTSKKRFTDDYFFPTAQKSQGKGSKLGT